MVVAEVWTAVGGVASIIAAVAALATVLYARNTVREAKDARAEAHRDHLDGIDREREASEAELTARRKALEAERALQRALQVQRIADRLITLVEVAREEHLHPPPVMSNANNIRATRLPSLVIHLRGALGFLRALGGPELPSVQRLVDERQTGEAPIMTLGIAVDALSEIGHLTGTDPSLRVDDESLN